MIAILLLTFMIIALVIMVVGATALRKRLLRRIGALDVDLRKKRR